MTGLASLIGRKVVIRPKAQDDWAVVCNMWNMGIGAPGLKKTPAQSEPLAPLRLLEKEAREAFKAAMAEYKRKVKEADDPDTVESRPRNATSLLTPPSRPWPRCCRRTRTAFSTSATSSVALLKLDLPEQIENKGFDADGLERRQRLQLRSHRPRARPVCACRLHLGGGWRQPAAVSQYVNDIRRGGQANVGMIQRFGLLVWPTCPVTGSTSTARPTRCTGIWPSRSIASSTS